MTLVAYDRERLDRLSMRMLDLCARLRHVARQCREDDLPPLELHDHKALEWLDKLEEWALRAETEVHRAALKQRGAKAAQSAAKSAKSK